MGQWIYIEAKKFLHFLVQETRSVTRISSESMPCLYTFSVCGGTIPSPNATESSLCSVDFHCWLSSKIRLWEEEKLERLRSLMDGTGREES